MDHEFAKAQRSLTAEPDDPHQWFVWAQHFHRTDRFAELVSHVVAVDSQDGFHKQLLQYLLEHPKDLMEELQQRSKAGRRVFFDVLLLANVDSSELFLQIYEKASKSQRKQLEKCFLEHKIPVESLQAPIGLQELAKDAPVVLFTGLMALLSGGQKPLLQRMIQSLKAPHSDLKEHFGRGKDKDSQKSL
jgi:hypothetical protein